MPDDSRTAITRELFKAMRSPVVWAAMLAVGVIVVAMWEPVGILVSRWLNDPDYAHGFLVPAFAVYLLWHRRKLAADLPCTPSPTSLAAAGVAIVTSAGILFASRVLFISILGPAALIPALAALLLTAGGWKALRWGWPSLVFLVFMLPLPGIVATMLSHPLQRIGTMASTAVLQTFGIPALSQGNVISLPEGQLEVVQACSGLKMMSLFFAVCVGAAMIVDRPWTDRLIIAISAPPIALLANIFRITLTGLLIHFAGHAGQWEHDLAGWLMMPVAVLLAFGELAILDRLFVASDLQGPLTLRPTPSRTASSSASKGIRPRR
ncbi:exosortase/archaeosortase family protein [Thermostilla marina]